MKDGTRAESTAPSTKTPPPSLDLDLLDCITVKELKGTHYRIATESREARERAGREFRMRQPGICEEYLPHGPGNSRVLAGENALICSFARHYCAAMEAWFGKVPVLRVEDLQATELRAQKLLAHGPTLKKVEKLGAVQFAVGGILQVHYFDGVGIVPDRQRVLLKVLTLLMCFSAASTKSREHNGQDHNQ